MKFKYNKLKKIKEMENNKAVFLYRTVVIQRTKEFKCNFKLFFLD